MEQLIYVSRAIGQVTAARLRHIVDTARMLNRRRNLTGVLAFSGSHFLQLLEGDAAALDRLLDSIRRDARHAEVRVLDRVEIGSRRFGDWAMALVSSPAVQQQIASLASGAAVDTVALDQLVQRLLRQADVLGDGANSNFAPF